MNVQDRRRILGPAEAKPLQFATSSSTDIKNDKPEHGTGESLFIDTDLVSNANGSSYLEYVLENKEQVLIMSSAFGPRPLRGSFQSKASLTIQLKESTLERFTSGEIKEICNFLVNVFNSVVNLEKYPKSGIDIFIDLIQHSSKDQKQQGNVLRILPACINAITLALVDAGIELIDLVSGGYVDGTVIAFIKNGQEITGIWSDDDSFITAEVVKKCKLKYLENKQTLVHYLKQSD